MSALWPQADLIIRTRLHQAKSHTTFPGMVFGTSHARMIRNVRHSTSGQSFYLCCHSGRVDVPNCSWNCQLAVGDNHPIPHPLAIILGHLMGHDAAGRRASGSRNTIPFFSSDKRRIIAGLGRQAMSTLGHKRTSGPVRIMSALPPKADITEYARHFTGS